VGLAISILPAALCLIAAAVVATRGLLPADAGTALAVAAWFVFAGGAVLALRFNRTRPALALALLGVTQVALASPQAPLALATALLVPLNLGLIGLQRERGLLTPAGMLKIGLLIGQVVGAAVLAGSSPERVTALARLELIGGWQPTLGQPALLTFALAAIILTVRWIRRRSPVEAGLLGALVAALLAMSASARDVEALYLLAGGAAVLLAIVETSYGLAYRDGLTGLPARRALSEELDKLPSRFTVAMVDVDHFKRFNDKYGHDVGDDVLRVVAARLGRVRGGGRAFRYGGEEFTVLFPGIDAATATPHLEALRQAIEQARLTLRGADRPKRKPKAPAAAKRPAKEVSVTVSIGVAEMSERHRDPEEVIKAADKALYKAKKAGRNRVMA
jgi:diguanylate cyclase (GGDEF)-like protein